MGGLDADSMRIAYMKILGSSRFKKLDLECPECEMKLGSRFMPGNSSVSYDEAIKDWELTKGQWNCFRSTCGSHGTWEVEVQNDYMYLSAQRD